MSTYYSRNRERLLELRKLRYAANKEAEQQRNYDNYNKHKENYKKQQFEYRQRTKALIAKRQKSYWSQSENKKRRNQNAKKRRKEDVAFKLKATLRVRLSNALRFSTKKGSAVKDVGCTIEDLKKYLESKFQEGMTWDNHGEWHIDHIKPLSSFNLTDRAQLLQACHYTNLQPLWAFDNLSKGNKYE